MPVTASDRQYIRDLDLGNTIRNCLDSNDFNSLFNFTVLLVPALEEVNELDVHELKLGPDLERLIRRKEYNVLKSRIQTLENNLNKKGNETSNDQLIQSEALN